MTLRALWPVVQQFQNKNGAILTGGKIYIYYQGRTALATTYHDEEGTVVNANPLLLDNNGRATVFADTIYSYTIVVCDYYGKELFSQDITIHYDSSAVRDVLVTGTDGSVKVDTTDLPNGVRYDLSVNTDIIATKESIDDVKTDLNTLTGTVDNHTTQIEDIKSTVANKKDKQSELNFNGSATKTVKSITQNVNGELNVEFADISLPQEVPNVEIKSKDNSIAVVESTDSQTNTKTFDLSINDEIPDPSTSNPLMDGAASVGSSSKYAREDHIHPTDTSREAIANKTTVILGTSDIKYPTDKAVAEFVNSSIATNTANYISNNGVPFTSVEQLNAYTGTVTNNDYAFVTGTDSVGNTYYDRYKATVKGSSVTWALEYRLNNSSFTAAQWSAINSGITSVLVAKIHDHSNKDVLDGITSSDIANWNSKQNNLTAGDNITIANNVISAANILNPTDISNYPNKDFNDLPSDNVLYYKNSSTNFENQPGRGAYRFIQWTASTYYSVQIAIDANNMLFARSSYRANPGDRFKTWEPWVKFQSELTFDTTPTAGSTNPVTSDGIKKALDSRIPAPTSTTGTQVLKCIDGVVQWVTE